MIAQTGSVYLTLCVSIERYVAVCLPLRARSICTFGRARWFVLMIGLFALLYNIPRFWEVTWDTSYYSDVGNVTAVISTDLREHPMYIIVYITWMYLVKIHLRFKLEKQSISFNLFWNFPGCHVHSTLHMFGVVQLVNLLPGDAPWFIQISGKLQLIKKSIAKSEQLNSKF